MTDHRDEDRDDVRDEQVGYLAMSGILTEVAARK